MPFNVKSSLIVKTLGDFDITSDLEKTFVDCLYKPDYGGGITEITKALYKLKDKIDYEKLFRYCKQFKA